MYDMSLCIIVYCDVANVLPYFNLSDEIIILNFESDQVAADVYEFMYFVFIHMPGERYHRQLRSLLLCFCNVF